MTNENTTTFKVGDHVKVVKLEGGFNSSRLNKIGVISYFDHGYSLNVFVEFDSTEDWGKLSEVELVSDINEIKVCSINDKLSQIEKLVNEVRELIG